jgi:hypothetical protein
MLELKSASQADELMREEREQARKTYADSLFLLDELEVNADWLETACGVGPAMAAYIRLHTSELRQMLWVEEHRLSQALGVKP